MQDAEHSEETTQSSMVEDALARIADKVREDSKEQDKLTPIESLETIVDDLTPEAISENLAAMAGDERYQDIRALVTPLESLYLFSDQYIAPPEAVAKGKIKDLQIKIADRVRNDSKSRAELTPAGLLSELEPEVQSEELQTALDELAGDDRYEDIKQVTASTGAGYLYSEMYMTGNYAGILVRAAGNDPCATIAATVRDESRIYPRPTLVDLFRDPIFNIEVEKLDSHVARLLELEEYQDIKKVVASTGSVYLYSDQYLDPKQAKALAEWNEVGQEENP